MSSIQIKRKRRKIRFGKAASIIQDISVSFIARKLYSFYIYEEVNDIKSRIHDDNFISQK